MHMVVEHKHKIGFKGDLLIEPKPQEPTKHQYDYDSATVFGFLHEYGLEHEIKVNIEANHATLAGHSFHHEIATAVSLGIFGSIDANRGDPQNGWDTDQFPNSVEEMTLATYEILKAGGFKNGGYNFDSKVRRQSLDEIDLFHGHVAAMDVLALALERAAAMVQNESVAAVQGPALCRLAATVGPGGTGGRIQPGIPGRTCVCPRTQPAGREWSAGDARRRGQSVYLHLITQPSV